MNRKLLEYGFLRIAGLLFLLMITLQTNAQFITIGTGTANTNGTGADPVDDYYNGMHYQTVYTATELSNAGLIGGSSLSSIGFDISQSPGTLANYTVKLAHTSQADAGTYIDPATTTFTTVVAPFSYTPTVTTAGSYDVILFTTNFTWDGTSNIVVDICTTPGNPFGSPYGGVRVSPSTNGASFIRGDAPNDQGVCSLPTGGFDPTFTYSVGVLADKPNVRFDYIPGTACSGTPVAGVAAASAPVAGGAVCPNTTFTLSTTGSTLASGLTYDWQFDNGGGWTPTGGTNATYVVTGGITVATSYRLIIGCGANYDTTNVVSLTVNPFYNCYCVPVSNCTNEGILNVTFDALNNSSAYCGSGYEDYGSLGALATVTQAQVVPITVSARANDVAGNHAGVWIDFDHNGSFDANEYTSLGNTGPITPPVTFAFTGNIVIPATAQTGITRMRVRSANNSGITATSACNTGTVYGEYEDYLITIAAGTACTGTPTAGTINPQSGVCPSVDFTLTATGFTNGFTGLTYEWQTYDVNTSSWIPAPGTNNAASYTAVGGITIPTDYRFVVTCTNGGGTDNTQPLTVAVNPVSQCYCIPATTSSTYYINNFSTTNGIINISNANSGYSTAGYGDYTATQTVSVLENGSFDFAGTFGSSTTYTFGVKIWVDWNQNGSFADAGEQMFATTGYTSSISGTIAVPPGALTGTTRMRVGANYLSSTGPANPCANFSSGEYEDYTLQVVALIPCSGMPSAGTASGPSAGCPGIAFTIASTGFTTGSGLTYEWQVFNTGTSTWDPLPGTNSNSSYTVTTGISTPTDYRFAVTCSNGGATDYSTITVGVHPFYNCYCIPVSNCTNEGIDSVGFDVLSNVSGFCANSGYSDYSSLGSLASVSQAQVVPMVIKAHINSNPASAGVWIDFDHNGSFDASEYTAFPDAVGVTPLPATHYFTANVVIDPNAMTGITRMRVRTANQSGITAASACNTSTVYGEYEDYLITINVGNACSGTPTAGTVNAPSTVCANIDFTLTSTGFSTGTTGLTYQWQIYNTGTSAWDPAPGTNNGPSYTATGGITTPTDYRFVVTCVNGGGSDATLATSIGINPPNQCYCTPSTTSNNYYINSFTTTGGTTNISNTASAYSGTGYGDFTANQTLTLQAGSAFGFNVIHGSSTTYTFGTKIWIDFGGDGSFAEPGDQVFASTGYASTFSGTINIAPTATPVTTRMRVGSNYNNSTGPADACATFANGEYEDYTIVILPPPACLNPTNVVASNVTATSVDINWDPVTGAAGFEYVLDQVATAPTGAGTFTTANTFSTTTLSATSTYYFHVRTDCGSSSYSPWVTISFATTPVNDVCAGAIAVPWTGSITANNASATTDVLPATTCGSTTAAVYYGLWYTVTPSASGALTIATCGASFDTYIRIYEGVCGTFTACTGYNDDGCAPASTYTIANAVANTTYYVLVTGYNASAIGTFTLQTSGVPLVTKLVDLSATNVGNRNRLDWTTASEDLGDYFEVERSADGNDFTSLGTVQANGKGSAYSFWDERPFSGISYYRLKMIDAAGTATYSKVVSATLKENGFAVHAYPNPATDKVTVTVSGTTGKNQTVTLTDITGKTIKSVTVVSGTAQIDMTALASGVYLIKYMDSNNIETIKINKR